jgi:hypothetical protein
MGILGLRGRDMRKTGRIDFPMKRNEERIKREGRKERRR